MLEEDDEVGRHAPTINAARSVPAPETDAACGPHIMVVSLAPVRIRFLTSTPLDIRRGSGTYVGIHVLARALAELGHTVAYETPRVLLPVFTAQRLLFNRD